MIEGLISLDSSWGEPSPADTHGGCGRCGGGQADSGGSACGNGLEKVYPTTAVRFGFMRYVGEFSHPPTMKFTCGAKVVIQTKRGIELGEQVSLTCSGCDKAVTREAMKDWVDRCGSDSFIFDAGRLLREATAADLAEYAHIEGHGRQMARFAQRVADRLGLALKIVECEHLLGGERIIFFFTAPERVDYRAMVKELAQEYRTRIEMRQIGARDEARLLADYETCGREVCCKVFLKTLRPISMRMAKLQKATLDPSQVSGRCGRLKCCLRYEHVGYEELESRLPRVGVRIRSEAGEGVVVGRQVLTQLLQIRTDADKLITIVAEDILEPPAPGTDASAKAAGASEAPGGQAAPASSPAEGLPPKTRGGRRRGRKRGGHRAPGHSAQAKPASPGDGEAASAAPSEPGSTPDGTTSNVPRPGGTRSGRRRRGQRNRGRRRRGSEGSAGEGSTPSPER
ncbi:MAG: regulatory iron-sulfur-containing complex subunit RicT [Phycisphaerae bacterium]